MSHPFTLLYLTMQLKGVHRWQLVLIHNHYVSIGTDLKYCPTRLLDSSTLYQYSAFLIFFYFVSVLFSVMLIGQTILNCFKMEQNFTLYGNHRMRKPPLNMLELLWIPFLSISEKQEEHDECFHEDDLCIVKLYIVVTFVNGITHK